MIHSLLVSKASFLLVALKIFSLCLFFTGLIMMYLGTSSFVFYSVWITPCFGVCEYVDLFSSVQFSSVAQLCPTLCDPMNLSTPGLPVHHQLLEFTQMQIKTTMRYHFTPTRMTIIFKKDRQSTKTYLYSTENYTQYFSITSDMQMTPPLWQKVKRK